MQIINKEINNTKNLFESLNILNSTLNPEQKTSLHEKGYVIFPPNDFMKKNLDKLNQISKKLIEIEGDKGGWEGKEKYYKKGKKFEDGADRLGNLLEKDEYKVEIRNYTIIYEAINDIRLALEGLLKPDTIEEVLGIAEVRDIFKVPKLGVIAGCMVKEGKVVRNSLLRLKRDGEIIHEGKITSLKRFKDDVAEVLEGFECGIGIEGVKDYSNEDLIEVYGIKEEKRKLEN